MPCSQQSYMRLLKNRGLFAACSEEPQQVGPAGKDFVQLYTCSKATETIDCPVFLKWQKAALFGGRPNILYYSTGNLNGHLFYLCPFLKSLHRKSPCKCTDLLNRKPHKIFLQTPPTVSAQFRTGDLSRVRRT